MPSPPPRPLRWWRPPLPREHGAWAQLAAATLAGLFMAPRGTPWLLAAAVWLLFLAREPLAVALGHRTARRRDAEGQLRMRQAASLGGAALVATALGLDQRWEGLLQPLAVAGVLGGLSLAMVVTDRDRTPSGEIAAAWAVAAVAALLAQAGGSAPLVGHALLLSWGCAFALDTLAVHAAKVRMLEADPPAWARHAWLPLGAAALAVGAWQYVDYGHQAAVTVWLLGGGGAIGGALVRRPRHLQAVGVALAVLCAAALVGWWAT